MEESKIIERLVANEERAKSNTKRIDSLEDKVENIHEIVSSVKILASETKAMREDVNKIDTRLKNVEEKPAKEYEDTKKQLKTKAISFFAGIILTYIALKFGLGNFI